MSSRFSEILSGEKISKWGDYLKKIPDTFVTITLKKMEMWSQQNKNLKIKTSFEEITSASPQAI